MSSSDFISSQDIVAELKRNERVNHRLPRWGRLQIDHQQPFLCVYRRPTDRRDRGTASLVSAQASVLMASNEASLRTYVDELASSILDFLEDVFGAVLFIEVWTSPLLADADQSDDTLTTRPISFRIHAPSHRAPLETLEILEQAIYAANWPGGSPKVERRYEDEIAPPGMDSLVSAEERKMNVIPMGLEILANYQDPISGVFFPLVLKEVRQSLNHVLREAVYAFSHSETKFRPAHFHELGPGAIDEVVFQVDTELGRINDAYDLLLLLTPVNIDQAWAEFSRSGYGKLPEFHYRPLPFDPSTLKHDLFHIPFSKIDDPALQELFSEKRDETEKHLSLLGGRGEETFMYDSLSLYRPPDSALVAQAKTIAETTMELRPSNASKLDAHAFAAHAKKEFAYYEGKGLSKDLKVDVRDDVAGILVVDGNFLISSSAKVAEERIEAALHHEVGTHVVTFENGRRQPFQLFHTGTAHYEELQEGLAVFAEYLCKGLTPQRVHQIACRVLAVQCLRDGASFVDTHRVLQKDYGLSGYSAFMMSMRLFRGGGFAKDVVYLRGLQKVLEFLREGGDLHSLYIGKLALHQHELCRELLFRGILTPPALIPRYLENDECRSRIERAVQADGVLNLLDEVIP